MADGESYRSLLEGMDEGFVVGDLVRDADGKVIDLRYVDMNHAGARFLGHPVHEVIGRLRSELLRPAPLDLLGPFAAAVAGGQVQRFELWSPSARRWYDVRVHPRGGDRIAVLYDDVTTRKRAEETLRENEARNRYLLGLA